jgi:Holliday junction resolvase RusA-like endonuclease
VIHVFVPGTPVPQGSVNNYHGRIVGVTPKLREWRLKIRAATMAKHSGPPLDGPITVHMVFQLAPPKKPRWWAPAVKPDADKLVRAVFDSLSTTKQMRGVIVDDARIVNFTAAKTYHGNPGVMITIGQAKEQP